MAVLIWDIYGKPMEKMDWSIIITNTNNKTDNLELQIMDKDGYNSYTNYMFIGYNFYITFALTKFSFLITVNPALILKYSSKLPIGSSK